MKLKLLQFSTNVLFALVMVVFWGTWFALSQSITGFSPQAFLEIGQTAIRNLAVPMRFLMPLSRLSAAFMLMLLLGVWAAWRGRRGPAGMLPLALVASGLGANMSGNFLAGPLIWFEFAYAFASDREGPQ